jgi:glycine/D-amino acid oxidase-like deaminating enzyme
MPDRGRSYDAAVLGAGCAGAAIAYSLARRRIIPVVIDTAGGETPAPAYPVASALRGNTPDVRLAIRAAERLADLQDAVGPFGYRRTGGMSAALTESDAAAGQARAQAAREAGLPVVWLSRDDVLRREPGLTGQLTGALYCGWDGVADASALKRRLLAAAVRFGGAVYTECGYLHIVRQGGGFRITAGREDLTARRLVLASGELLQTVGRPLGVDLPLRFGRRRICITDRVAPALRNMVSGIRQEPSGAFVLDPPLLVEEHSVLTIADEVETLQRIVAFAAQLVPGIELTRILHAPQWVVAEPADGRPALGRLGDDLFIAVAAEDQAAMLAPMIGEATAEALSKHRWPDGLEVWAAQRFTAAASARATGVVQDSMEGA